MKRFCVNVFYSTFIPYAVEAGSQWEALRKARAVAADRGWNEAEAREFLFHLERLSERDEVGLTDPED